MLELKSVADVGLVGFPSAGKSSLVAALSAARPKIADYPFTTLVPNLGVVSAGEKTFTVADVPGLIPGAAQGKGLGLDFLRHVERCAVLLHVLDCATLEPGRDPLSDLDAIEAELGQYRGTFGELLAKPRLVALNKVDVPEARELAELVRPELRARGPAGVRDLGGDARGPARADVRARRRCAADRAARPAVEPTRIVLRPRAVDDAGFTVAPTRRSRAGTSCAARSPSAGSARPTSTTTRRWAISPTGSPRLGVEDELARLGAEPGAAVTIGDVTFDFEPSGGIDPDYVPTRRGADERLDAVTRPNADERLAAKKARRVHDARTRTSAE